MSDKEELELKALMMAYGALTFVLVKPVHEAFTAFNQGLTETIFPPEAIPRGYTRAQIKDATDVLFGMILERGDPGEIDAAVAKARPEVRVRIGDALAADRERMADGDHD